MRDERWILIYGMNLWKVRSLRSAEAWSYYARENGDVEFGAPVVVPDGKESGTNK